MRPSARAKLQRAWQAFVSRHLAPLGITEGAVFAIVGKGLLGDPLLSSGTTSDMIRLHELALELGVELESRRIPSTEYFADPSAWPWRIDSYAPFGDQMVKLYDLVAARVPAQRRSIAWEKGQVDNVFNQRAAGLVADILNALGCVSRPFTARDVKNRLTKRGRRANR